MRPPFFPTAILPLSLWTLVNARIHNSLVPEDPFAFPKYRVTFLNGLPLLNETAQRWLENGLRGGELEFLDQPWQEDEQWRTPPVKSIDGGSREEGHAQQAVAAEVGPYSPATSHRLRTYCMRFVCTARDCAELQTRANETEPAGSLSVSNPSTPTG